MKRDWAVVCIALLFSISAALAACSRPQVPVRTHRMTYQLVPRREFPATDAFHIMTADKVVIRNSVADIVGHACGKTASVVIVGRHVKEIAVGNHLLLTIFKASLITELEFGKLYTCSQWYSKRKVFYLQ